MATTEATTRTDYTLGFTSQDEETHGRPAAGHRRAAGLAHRRARARDPRPARGRRDRGSTTGSTALAMLNRFGFADGRVSYGSRFIESRAYEDAKEGEWRHGGFATDPCRSIFKRVQQIFSPDVTDNPNVNLARIGERYIAMTETPMPIEFDPETLDTIGHLEYADKLKAHSHDGAPAPRRGSRRARELRRALLARERVRALRPAGRELGAARDRPHAGQGAGLHARVRDERALPDPGRVPAAREPAEARLLGQAVHRELHLAAGRAHPLPGASTARPASCAAPTRRTRSSASTT